MRGNSKRKDSASNEFNTRIHRLEDSITLRIDRLEDSVSGNFKRVEREISSLSRSYHHLIGFLEGAGSVKRKDLNNDKD